MKKNTVKDDFYQDIKRILAEARNRAYRAIDFAIVEAYWNVGRRIVEEEQRGKRRAVYGIHLLENLSERLTNDLGKGYTEANLRNFRQFYLTFPKDEKIRYALRSELSWAHYRMIMRLDNPRARDYYMTEAAEGGWSSRALERQINSHYYERLLTSRNKASIKKEVQSLTKTWPKNPCDLIKYPYVLDFLGLDEKEKHHEKDIEQAILNQLQKFLLELGRGFSFVSRQHRMSSESREFYIDLVFYNYILKCFVLIDLKIGELTHQDIGQMDMYLRMFEDKNRGTDDNPTIGIILCAEKDETVVKYSVIKNNKKLFASKYKLYLPTERELIEELNREQRNVLLLTEKK